MRQTSRRTSNKSHQKLRSSENMRIFGLLRTIRSSSVKKPTSAMMVKPMSIQMMYVKGFKKFHVESYVSFLSAREHCTRLLCEVLTILSVQRKRGLSAHAVRYRITRLTPTSNSAPIQYTSSSPLAIASVQGMRPRMMSAEPLISWPMISESHAQSNVVVQFTETPLIFSTAELAPRTMQIVGHPVNSIICNF